MNWVGSWGHSQDSDLSNKKPFLQFLQMMGSGPRSLRESGSHCWVGRELLGGNATGLKAGMLRERGVASEPPGDAVMGGITLHPGKKPQYSSLPSFDAAWRMIN